VPDGSTKRRVAAPKRPTISDVAALAGTSKGTVSFVLNGRPGVAPTTRERVLAAIQDLGFAPSQVARSLSNSRAGVIGLVLARTPQTLRADPFFAPFIAGVEFGITESDNLVLLRFVDGEQAELSIYQRLAKSRQVDGFILADLRHDDARLPLLRELHMPAVTLNRPDVDSSFVAVCNDETSGIQQAAAHLVALGHRRIAHVSGPPQYLHAMQRDATWRRALAAHGVDLAGSVSSDFTADGGAHATRSLLAGAADDRPTAIVYDNDTMALAGAKAAQALGFDVPADVSVVGFDDAELSAHVSPSLTTIRTDPFAWGETAARTLLRVIDGADPGAEVSAGTSTLIPRASTAPRDADRVPHNAATARR
jgi:DNA-binding LacI/PurR family transcriptional regulator